eukprot:TRINITY_DN8995_c0_g1_i7.p2 TRINITY_DN8995_c0_g1~~TRINITY_DN8995_c0_g1_i7.p2  ORF type:complete len:105 (+),score=27.45 TRINITY_DN8995_c0_g1_i7:25-315(+)
MIRRPPRSTHCISSAASDVYKRQTLSSPHLGYLFHTSSLVNVGMWFLKAWQQSTCLSQLSLADHKDLAHTFLYRLANSPVNHILIARELTGSKALC